MSYSRAAAAVIAIATLAAASCANIRTTTGPNGGGASPETAAHDTELRPSAGRAVRNIRAEVVEGARSLIGKETLVVKGRAFPYDCTGLVRAAYWYAGIDLAKDFSKYSGNGVARLFKTFEAYNLLYLTETPLPADIAFWDNTYDQNVDGKWNDPFTHVGVVAAVSDAGQIEYIHLNYRKGIIIEYMNLADPDTNTMNVGGNVIFANSAMRMQGQIVNEMWLSSHLLREFGKGYLLE